MIKQHKTAQLSIFKDVDILFDTGKTKDNILQIHKTLFKYK